MICIVCGGDDAGELVSGARLSQARAAWGQGPLLGLAERLQPHVGETIDLVEIANGNRFVRPVLEEVLQRGGQITALR
ncbi:MAG: hypothetical protein WCJ21_12510, partial [Planctomycetota bacterium]